MTWRHAILRTSHDMTHGVTRSRVGLGQHCTCGLVCKVTQGNQRTCVTEFSSRRRRRWSNSQGAYDEAPLVAPSNVLFHGKSRWRVRTVRCSDFVAVGGMCVFRPKILGGRLHVARRVQLKFLRLLARRAHRSPHSCF